MDTRQETIDKFVDIQNIYLKKFGDSSLDWVNEYDPLLMVYEDYTQNIIKRFEKAIKNNKPFPKFIPPEGVEIIY